MPYTGLASYAAVVKEEFNDYTTLAFNVTPLEIKKIFVIVNLYNSIYKNGLNFSFIYSDYNKQNDIGYGRGITYNFYNYIAFDSDVTLTLYDGRVLLFNKIDNKYENKEIGGVIEQNSENNITLTLENKTIIKYEKINDKILPKTIIYRNKDSITFEYNDLCQVLSIMTNYSEKLQFIYQNDKEFNIQVTKNGSEIKHITVIKYSDENIDCLKEIIIRNKNSDGKIVKHLGLKYTLDRFYYTLQLDDYIAKIYCRALRETEVTTKSNLSYLDKYYLPTVFDNDDSEYYVNITKYFNKKYKMFCDAKGRLICFEDVNLKIAYSYIYNENNKLISQSLPLYFDSNKNGEIIPRDEYGGSFKINTISEPSYLSNFTNCFNFESSDSPTDNRDAGRIKYNKSGKANEIFTLGLWYRVNSCAPFHPPIEIVIHFYKNDVVGCEGHQYCQKIQLNTINGSEFEFVALTAYTLVDYDYILIGILQHNGGYVNVDLVCDLYQQGLTVTNIYNEDNSKIIKVINPNELQDINYDENNDISSTEYQKYYYDESGNLIMVSDSLGNIINYSYDSKNNLLKEENKDKDGNYLYIENNYLNYEFLNLTVDENNVITFYKYNNYYLPQECYDSSLIIRDNYSNENFEEIESKQYLTYLNQIEISNIKYEYNNKQELSNIIFGSLNYIFKYDNYGRLEEIYYADNYKYLAIKYNSLDEIENIVIGNETFNYTYDNNGLIKQILYKKGKDEQITLYSFSYTQFGEIENISNHQTNINYSYTYQYTNLIKYEIFIEGISENFIYNKVNKLLYEEKVLNNNTYLEFKNIQANNPTTMIDNYMDNIIYKDGLMLGMFYNLATIENPNNRKTKIYLKENNKIIFDSKDIEGQKDSNCKNIGVLPYFEVTYATLPENSFLEFKVDDLKNQSISIVFAINYQSIKTKSYQTEQTNLFSLASDNNVEKLDVLCSDEGIITLKYNNKSVDFFEMQLEKNVFEFICISYEKTSGKIHIYKNADEIYDLTIGNLQNVCIIKFLGNIIGKLSNIMISKNEVLSHEKYLQYYRAFTYLLSVNSQNDNNITSIVSTKQIIKHNDYSTFLPLSENKIGITNDGFNNFQKLYPLKEENVKYSLNGMQKIDFKYDSTLNKFVYYAFGQQLTYQTFLSDGGAISLKFKIFRKLNRNTIFELKDTNNNGFEIYYANGCIEAAFVYNNTSKIVTIEEYNININTWYFISMSWSSGNKRYLYLKFKFENNEITSNINFSEVLEQLELYVGCSSVKANKNTYLNGCIDELEYHYFDNYENDKIILTHRYNSLNQLQEYSINSNSNKPIVHNYVYKYIDSKTKRISNLIEKEIINGVTYEYTYDSKNNITKITKDAKNFAIYTYDELNRLISETDENNIKTQYNYNAQNNIIECVTNGQHKTFTYLSDLRLTKCSSIQIEYGEENKLYPIKISNSTLSYEGTALIKYENVNGTDVNYFYDAYRRRIQKDVIKNGITTTYKYYYDVDGKLIMQQSNNNSLTFYYDDLDILCGFEYQNLKYYYLRNILGNILGIVGETGQILVTYTYNAWGKITKIEDNSGCGLANINPFRYKGYYYDDETQLYWVSSRYYSPELCRWISPDSIEYLDPQSINGLNLYCYCFNNPVNYVDPDGHMPFLCALLILGAIGMVANVGSQALTDLAYGNEFKWENYLVAAGAGFLGGMCYAIPGVGSIVSAAVTSGLTTAGQMAVSGEDYDGWDYLIMAGGSAVLSGLTAWGFGKLSNNMAFFKDSNFILDNFTKFATNYGGITLKPTVILQAAGQIAIRETVAGFVGAPLSGIPGYFDRVYRLNKLGLSPADSFRYAF